GAGARSSAQPTAFAPTTAGSSARSEGAAVVERAHLRGPLLREGARLGRRHRHASRRRLLLLARSEPRLDRPSGTIEPRSDRVRAPLLGRSRRAPPLRPPVL